MDLPAARFEWLNPLVLSLQVACLATVFAGLIAVPLAWWLTRQSRAARAANRNAWFVELIDSIVVVPMVLPPTVLGYYLLVVLGRESALGHWLSNTLGIQLIFTFSAAVIAAAVVTFPLIVKGSRSAFEATDETLFLAARTLGMGLFARFFRIGLPLAWRGVFSASLLGFARAFGEFGATLMVAGSIPGQTRTLSIAIYEAVQSGQENQAAFMSAIACVLAVVVVWCANLSLRKDPYRVT